MFSQEYVDKRRLYAMKVILMIMQRSKEIRCKFVHYGGMELCMSIMEDMSDLPRLRFVAACCLALFTGDEDALREMLKSGKAGDLLRSAINTVHQGLILMRRRPPAAGWWATRSAMATERWRPPVQPMPMLT